MISKPKFSQASLIAWPHYNDETITRSALDRSLCGLSDHLSPYGAEDQVYIISALARSVLLTHDISVHEFRRVGHLWMGTSVPRAWGVGMPPGRLREPENAYRIGAGLMHLMDALQLETKEVQPLLCSCLFAIATAITSTPIGEVMERVRAMADRSGDTRFRASVLFWINFNSRSNK